MNPEFELPLEMIQRYVERRAGDLLAVEEAIQNKDFETLKRIGHQIKGNAATFSFKDLEKIAIQLEDCGLQHDLYRAKELGCEFRIWLSSQECLLSSLGVSAYAPSEI